MLREIANPDRGESEIGRRSQVIVQDLAEAIIEEEVEVRSQRVGQARDALIGEIDVGRANQIVRRATGQAGGANIAAADADAAADGEGPALVQGKIPDGVGERRLRLAVAAGNGSVGRDIMPGIAGFHFEPEIAGEFVADAEKQQAARFSLNLTAHCGERNGRDADTILLGDTSAKTQVPAFDSCHRGGGG
jgi:hypothetical protein